MGKNNMKSKNEEYERRNKMRKAEKIAKLQAELDQDDSDEPLVNQQIKIDAKNLIIVILLILAMVAVPSFEQ